MLYTDQQKGAFIRAYRTTYTQAAIEAGVALSTVLTWKKYDHEFKETLRKREVVLLLSDETENERRLKQQFELDIRTYLKTRKRDMRGTFVVTK